MQRITLNLDIANNKILDKELQKVIEGAAKAKARETVQDTIVKEIDRCIEKSVERWTEKPWGGAALINRRVDEKVDAAIKAAIGEITVSRQDIVKRINEKMGEIGAIIEAEAAKSVSRETIEDYIGDIVREEVRKGMSDKILDLLVGRT